MHKQFLISAIAGALFISASPVAAKQTHQPVDSGTCTFGKTEFLSAPTAMDSTNGVDGWHNVGDAGSTTFTTKNAGCVTATFSAIVDGDTGTNQPLIQVLLNGTQTCDPGPALYVNSFGGYNTMSFTCFSVPAGQSTVQIQFENSYSGYHNTAILDGRTLTVQHKR